MDLTVFKKPSNIIKNTHNEFFLVQYDKGPQKFIRKIVTSYDIIWNQHIQIPAAINYPHYEEHVLIRDNDQIFVGYILYRTVDKQDALVQNQALQFNSIQMLNSTFELNNIMEHFHFNNNFWLLVMYSTETTMFLNGEQSVFSIFHTTEVILKRDYQLNNIIAFVQEQYLAYKGVVVKVTYNLDDLMLYMAYTKNYVIGTFKSNTVYKTHNDMKIKENVGNNNLMPGKMYDNNITEMAGRMNEVELDLTERRIYHPNIIPNNYNEKKIENIIGMERNMHEDKIHQMPRAIYDQNTNSNTLNKSKIKKRDKIIEMRQRMHENKINQMERGIYDQKTIANTLNEKKIEKYSDRVNLIKDKMYDDNNSEMTTAMIEDRISQLERRIYERKKMKNIRNKNIGKNPAEINQIKSIMYDDKNIKMGGIMSEDKSYRMERRIYDNNTISNTDNRTKYGNNPFKINQMKGVMCGMSNETGQNLHEDMINLERKMYNDKKDIVTLSQSIAAKNIKGRLKVKYLKNLIMFDNFVKSIMMKQNKLQHQPDQCFPYSVYPVI